MSLDRRRHFEALGALLLANLFWGLSFPLIKAISATHKSLDPSAGGWFVTAMTIAPRFLIASVVVGVWLLRQSRPTHAALFGLTRGEWKQGVGLGLFAAGGMLFQNDGLQHTHASTSAFLTQLYAVLIPLWIAVRVRRAPPRVVWAAMALVLVGGAVLARLDPADLRLGRGETETLLSSFFFMGQILLLSRVDFAGNRPLAITQVMFLVEGAIFCVLALAWAPESAAVLVPWRSMPWLGLTLLLTAFCTLGAFLLMNMFQPRITATEAGLIYCIEPIFGAALALFLPAWFSAWAGIDYPNESVTTSLFFGGALITAANVVLQLRPPPAVK
jgi:drug/metabolite transporter (DMT)-like permease